MKRITPDSSGGDRNNGWNRRRAFLAAGTLACVVALSGCSAGDDDPAVQTSKVVVATPEQDSIAVWQRKLEAPVESKSYKGAFYVHDPTLAHIAMDMQDPKLTEVKEYASTVGTKRYRIDVFTRLNSDGVNRAPHANRIMITTDCLASGKKPLQPDCDPANSFNFVNFTDAEVIVPDQLGGDRPAEGWALYRGGERITDASVVEGASKLALGVSE